MIADLILKAIIECLLLVVCHFCEFLMGIHDIVEKMSEVEHPVIRATFMFSHIRVVKVGG